MRIISLVPSITELLYSLGLEEEIVGITKFCVHPQKWFRSKQKIGGPKNIHIEKIKSLQPDYIIASKEENNKEQVEALAANYPVHITDVKNYTDALQMIHDMGSLTQKNIEAAKIVKAIEENFAQYPINRTLTAAYMIWKNPWLTVGGDTFIHSMMAKAGFINVFAEKNRYPQTTLAEIQSLQPQYLLLSSEPYPFNTRHVAEIQKQFDRTKIILVDGETFSWYGSRMLQAAEYFKNLL